MSVAAPDPGSWGEPDPRGRPLVYAVGPGAEVEDTTPMELRPALLRGVLAAVATLAVLVGGGVVAIWLVLAPVMPAGAASAQLRQPWPGVAGASAPGGHSNEPTVVDSEVPATTPRNTCRFSLSW
ncbi:MAG TPA: hypothetical protein VNP92_06460 [Actinophytocola sp.]|nr:hypothetical protein [Actinophytocola sp.]